MASEDKICIIITINKINGSNLLAFLTQSVRSCECLIALSERIIAAIKMIALIKLQTKINLIIELNIWPSTGLLVLKQKLTNINSTDK